MAANTMRFFLLPSPLHRSQSAQQTLTSALREIKEDFQNVPSSGNKENWLTPPKQKKTSAVGKQSTIVKRFKIEDFPFVVTIVILTASCVHAMITTYNGICGNRMYI